MVGARAALAYIYKNIYIHMIFSLSYLFTIAIFMHFSVYKAETLRPIHVHLLLN